MYNFDPGEEEEDDWETELLDECYNTHQRRVCKIAFVHDLHKCFKNKNHCWFYSKDTNPWILKKMQSYSVVTSSIFLHSIYIIFSLSYNYYKLKTFLYCNFYTHVIKHIGIYNFS